LAHRNYLKKDTVVQFDVRSMPHVPKIFYAASPEIEEAPPDHKSSTVLQQDHVLVSILTRSPSSSSYHGLVGSVRESRSSHFQPGDLVAGVVKEGVTSHITCSAGSIIRISEGVNINAVADHSLPLVVASIVLGPERGLDAPKGAPPLKVMLANDDDLSKDLFTLLSLVPNLAIVSRHDAPLNSQFDVIVSSLEESETHPEFACWGGNLLLWDKTLTHLFDEVHGASGTSRRWR